MIRSGPETGDIKEGACACHTTRHELALLETFTMDQLREKWRQLFDGDAPRYKKQFLLRRLAYRIQERFYGGISNASRSRLKHIAQGDALARVEVRFAGRDREPGRILPGTRFVRIWNNSRYEVIAGPVGFEYDGQVYRSLSAVARKITGTRWNGRLFFGLVKTRESGGQRV